MSGLGNSQKTRTDGIQPYYAVEDTAEVVEASKAAKKKAEYAFIKEPGKAAVPCDEEFVVKQKVPRIVANHAYDKYVKMYLN